MLLVVVALPCVIAQRWHYQQAGVACSQLAEVGIAALGAAYTVSVLFRDAPLAQQLSVAARVRVSVDALGIAADCATYVAFAITVRGLLRLAEAYRAYLHGEGTAFPQMGRSRAGAAPRHSTSGVGVGAQLLPHATVSPLAPYQGRAPAPRARGA